MSEDKPHAQTKRPVRAILYARVASSASVDHAKVRDQLQQCMTLATELGAKVQWTFADVGVSGSTLDRPGLHKIFDHLANEPTDFLICQSPTVLGRDPLLVKAAETHAADLGSRVIYADQSSNGR